MNVRIDELGEPFATGRSAQVYAWPGSDLIVKLFEPGYSPDLVDLEEESIREAMRIGLDTAACHGQVRIDDRPGLLLERVSGESLTRQAERNPLRIRSGAQALARTHVALHSAPTTLFTDVREATVAALETDPLAFLSAGQRDLAAQFVRSLPAGDRILHLDFHTENVFVDGDRHIVIDWQTTLRGDPAADVAMTVLLIHDAELWPGTPLLKRILIQRIRGVVLSTYLAQYQRLTGMARAQIDMWRLPVIILRMSTLDVVSERSRFQQEVRDILAGMS